LIAKKSYEARIRPKVKERSEHKKRVFSKCKERDNVKTGPSEEYKKT